MSSVIKNTQVVCLINIVHDYIVLVSIFFLLELQKLYKNKKIQH